MKKKNRTKPKRSNLVNTKRATRSAAVKNSSAVENAKNTNWVDPSVNMENIQTMASPPENSLAGGISSMFNNAQNIHITGGSFIIATNVNTSNGSPLDVLYKRVAPNAILNAGGRVDEVRCHPGTREEVIGRIEKWGDTRDGRTTPIFWLSGPAGAGKSAVVQTVAERCKERGVPHANFFFFRGDPSRSHASPLIATLLHQIIQIYPSLRDPVANILSNNPLSFDSTLEDQLEQLIASPLYSILPSSQVPPPLLLLVDGLDECDSETKHSQEQILRAFDKTLARYSGACPFRVLVASRNEAQIQVAFNKMTSECLNLYLNDQYSPQKDIMKFVLAQFNEVKKTHRLAYMLDASWPSVDDVNYIVEKSSGQFIYAVTVMRFISGSSADPMVSLERVRGITQLATKSPYSQLDAIYSYILSQVDDQEALKDVLSAQLFLWEVQRACTGISYMNKCTLPITEFMSCFNQRYTSAIVYSCLEDLTPLLEYKATFDNLLFHHASLSDYLLDPSRSGHYFVDTIAFSYSALPELWKSAHRQAQHLHVYWAVFGLVAISRLPKLPPGILKLLTSSMKSRQTNIPLSSDVYDSFKRIFCLCLSDNDVIDYRHLLRVCLNEHNIPLEAYSMKDIPFGLRYYLMASAEQYHEWNDFWAHALCPRSDFDRQESALWLADLLISIRSNTVTRDDADRDHLETQWRSWADANGIPHQDHLVLAARAQ